MKRKIAFILTAALLFGLTACGAVNDSDNTDNLSAQTERRRAAENSQAAENGQAAENRVQHNGKNSTESAENAGIGKILIAYFSVAENSDVDAVSSASVTQVNGEAKGLVRTVAEDIQAVTGGDMFSIETSVDYPGNINDLIDYASAEQDNDERPVLTSHIENLDEYDTIFVGYPLWWYDLPQVMYSFFDEYDFSGKTIIPFDVHRGSRLSGTPDTIQKLKPDATVISDGFTVSHETASASVSDVAADVEKWLRGLGY